MHMFFAGVAKGGRSFTVEERQRFIDTVRSEVVFSAHVRQVVHLAPTPGSIVVGISDEPDGGWHQTWRREIFLSGYCTELDALTKLQPTLALAEDASHIAGRFSALVVDRLRGSFALATQPARVDSIFVAENDRCRLFGNQASVVSALRDGSVRYAPSRLLTFINGGFFAHEDTPYEGVRCLSPFTTLLVINEHVTEQRICLSTLGNADEAQATVSRDRDRHSQTLPNEMISDFVSVFSSLKTTRCELGLTGGMDSRLILAGAVAAGRRLECYTYAYNDVNRADVWIARQLAELAQVRYQVLDEPRFMLDGATPFERLRQTARWTLAATDGMMGAQYPVEPFFQFLPVQNLEGTAGGLLRGGYGERVSRPTEDQVVRHMQHLWNHSPQLCQADVVAEQNARSHAFVAGFPEWVTPGDMLYYLYLEMRCGRWSAAANCGSSTRIRPLLENRMVRHALRIPQRMRRNHLVHRQLLANLFPAAADLPIANKFWHGTPEAEREALRLKWPQAFTESKKETPKGTLTLEEINGIKEYVIDSGRLSLLADVLRVDDVVRYVSDKAPNDRYYDRFLKSLLSAAVLLSEYWRDLRYADPKLIPRLGVPAPS